MRKLLVANRSEIAIRCFRAATELGLRTVAVYSYEDRFSLHRFKADEAFLIGPPAGRRAGPLVPEHRRAHRRRQAARRRRDPPRLRLPRPRTPRSRARARTPASRSSARRPSSSTRSATRPPRSGWRRQAGVPTIPGTEHGARRSGGRRGRPPQQIGYPLIIKASFGGGGRGMRVVQQRRRARRTSSTRRSARPAPRSAGPTSSSSATSRAPSTSRCRSSATRTATWCTCGSATARCSGATRRSSRSRRASTCRRTLRAAHLRRGRRGCAGRSAIATPAPSSSCSTSTAASSIFIEVNPRIQVEHTVTEVVTGIDLVRSQILVAEGHKLHEAPLNIPAQDAIERRGVAIQCRITTEDPDRHFIPDYGRITTYRSAGGFAVRLDGGNGFGGAVITPYFDSLLVKVTTWGGTLEEAAQRARPRAARVPHPRREDEHPVPAEPDRPPDVPVRRRDDDVHRRHAGAVPLPRAARPRDASMLSYLGDVIVNGRPDVKGKIDPAAEAADAARCRRCRRSSAPPPGTRQKLLELGPEQFADWVRERSRLLITDTTLRDAHQSLLATRVRTYDMLAVADAVARLTPGSVQPGDVGRRDVRHVDALPPGRPVGPARRAAAAASRTSCSRCCCAPATPSATRTIRTTSCARSSSAAPSTGIDVFRIFDSLNSTDNMKLAIEAVRDETERRSARPRSATPATSSIRRARSTRSNYYVRMAKELVADGHAHPRHQGHGRLCKPYAAYALVKALRDEVDVPIHFHTHDTSGINAGSILRAADAGVDIADAAIASMSGMTSQPYAERHRRRAAAHARATPGSTRTRSTSSAATGRPSASSTTRSRKG